MAFLPLSYVSGCYSKLGTMYDNLKLAYESLDTAGIQFIAAGVGLGDPNLEAAGYSVRDVAYDLHVATNALGYGTTNNFRYYLNQALTWIRANLNSEAGGTVDMAAINAAMHEANWQEVRDHLSMQWAYQQVMYDQPFYPEQYIAIVNELRT